MGQTRKSQPRRPPKSDKLLLKALLGTTQSLKDPLIKELRSSSLHWSNREARYIPDYACISQKLFNSKCPLIAKSHYIDLVSICFSVCLFLFSASS